MMTLRLGRMGYGLLLLTLLLIRVDSSLAEWVHLGAVTSHDRAKSALTVRCGSAAVRIEAINDHVVRVRMSPALANQAHSDLRKIGPRRGDLDVLEAAQREPLDELGVRGQIDEFRQPVERQSHQTCSNTRRSPSKSSRMLGMP